MANWLSAAGSVFGRNPSSEPQTYELKCSCGRTVGGVRASTYQQITCPACRQRLFVLPASVYPRPKSGRPRSKPPPKPRPSVDDEPVVERPAPVQAVAEKPGRKPQPSAKAAPRAPSRPTRILTPVRGVALAIAVATLAAVWGISHSRAVKDAELRYAAAVQKGRDALNKDDLTAAAQEFAAAASALDILGRDDPTARTVRQLHRETNAAVNLVDKSPQDLLVEGIKSSQSSDEDWKSTFQYSYRNTWIIIDAELVEQVNSDGAKLDINYPLQTAGQEGEVVVDSPILRSVATTEAPRRVIFAAQVEDLKRHPKTASLWQLVLRPDTLFLVSNPDVYSLLLGQPPDEGTKKVLADQTAALQLPPWTREGARP